MTRVADTDRSRRKSSGAYRDGAAELAAAYPDSPDTFPPEIVAGALVRNRVFGPLEGKGACRVILMADDRRSAIVWCPVTMEYIEVEPQDVVLVEERKP